ncbi:peptidase inhibitor family I36 protein [Micromonospora sp. NPDC007208]|uniref:peptidase inhibitor family I36 protein n=1 Tax=Micromonospora sp. NPDC007208 TaxID=3364236 RepID=UPI0036CDE648
MAATTATVGSPAAASRSQCNLNHLGKLCLWTGTNYTGSFYADSLGKYCTTDGSATHRSAENMNNWVVVLYSGASCTGTAVTLTAGQERSNLGISARSWRAV